MNATLERELKFEAGTDLELTRLGGEPLEDHSRTPSSRGGGCATSRIWRSAPMSRSSPAG